MIIYSDVISNDEIISDAFDIKEINDTIYEVDCKMITIKEGDVDIGANASAEEADEALDDSAQTVNNVVHSFQLQSTQFDKKSYTTYIKGYMKQIRAYLAKENPDRVQAFESGASGMVKKILANFGDYEFYTGGSMDPSGMVLLLNYREDGVTPFFTIWKDGLKGIKV